MSELDDFLKLIAVAKSQDPKEIAAKHVRETIQEDLSALFAQLDSTVTKDELHSHTPNLEKVLQEEIVEIIETAEEKEIITEVVEPQAPEERINAVAKYINSLPSDSHSFQQPIVETPKELKMMQDKIKFLEQWVGKISATGPGGGAGEIYNLDMPTRVVSTDYTVDRKDYYIGVDANVKINITLPLPGKNLKNGRTIVIKDESGHAQLTPIKIIGTIDNDPNGAELRINNGAIQFIWRSGSWRII